jgi:hypothetical protein
VQGYSFSEPYTIAINRVRRQQMLRPQTPSK